MTNYDVDYFIKKFKAIPDSLWTVEKFIDSSGRRCALGHCGLLAQTSFAYVNETNTLTALTSKFEEAAALINIFPLKGDGLNMIAWINNGHHPKYQQPTPKARVLAALLDVKKSAINFQTVTFKNVIEEELTSVN